MYFVEGLLLVIVDIDDVIVIICFFEDVVVVCICFMGIFDFDEV